MTDECTKCGASQRVHCDTAKVTIDDVRPSQKWPDAIGGDSAGNGHVLISQKAVDAFGVLDKGGYELVEASFDVACPTTYFLVVGKLGITFKAIPGFEAFTCRCGRLQKGLPDDVAAKVGPAIRSRILEPIEETWSGSPFLTGRVGNLLCSREVVEVARDQGLSNFKFDRIDSTPRQRDHGTGLITLENSGHPKNGIQISNNQQPCFPAKLDGFVVVCATPAISLVVILVTSNFHPQALRYSPFSLQVGFGCIFLTCLSALNLHLLLSPLGIMRRFGSLVAGGRISHS